MSLYIFVIRRGGESLNARKEYESNQSEELIRTLHEQGIEMFHTHLYKGFGMAARGRKWKTPGAPRPSPIVTG